MPVMDFGVILVFPTISAQIYILFYIIKNFRRVADQTIPSKHPCFNVTEYRHSVTRALLSFDGHKHSAIISFKFLIGQI